MLQSRIWCGDEWKHTHERIVPTAGKRLTPSDRGVGWQPLQRLDLDVAELDILPGALKSDGA